MSFSGKTLSLENAYLSLGILKNLIKLLISGSSGDISITSEKLQTLLIKNHTNPDLQFW